MVCSFTITTQYSESIIQSSNTAHFQLLGSLFHNSKLHHWLICSSFFRPCFVVVFMESSSYKIKQKLKLKKKLSNLYGDSLMQTSTGESFVYNLQGRK